MSRARAVAIGYQGFGNVGDEAILSGIERLLEGSGVRVEAVVAGSEPVSAFADARRIRTRRLRPSLEAIRALRHARLLLVSGGGLLNDHWATVVPTYFGWVLLARLLGVRVAWLGVGVGPLRRRWARWLAGRTLGWSSLVTVRDQESASLVGEIAPGAEVSVVPDPAIFNTAPPPMDRRGIGFVVRPPTPADGALAPALAQSLGEALAILQSRGSDAALLTFGGGRDLPFAERVAVAARQAGGRSPRIEQVPPDPEAAMRGLAGLEALLSLRLHGLILGAVVGTPTVSLAYDRKVSSWAERLGVSDYCLPMQPITGAEIADALDAVRSSDAPERMAERVASLRAESDRIRSMIGAIA